MESQNILQENRVFENLVDAINNALVLPTDVKVVLAECGEENAFYVSTEKKILLCYELMGSIAESFSELELSEEDYQTAVGNSILFVFYHEVGHALIDVLDLPATGKEEDVADQFASLILIESGQNNVALDGATWFYLEGMKTDLESLAFWDEHSLDLQRFYNIACLIYGEDPEKYSFLVEQEILPSERADGCQVEYQQIFNSWNVLLESYSKS